MAARAASLVVAVLLVATLTQTTRSTFTAPSRSDANAFASRSSFSANTSLTAGFYIGNGEDDRPISTGSKVDLLFVKAADARAGVVRMSSMPGDLSRPIQAGSGGLLQANLIQAVGASGFTLGTDDRVNAPGVKYYWTAFTADGVNLRVGSYAGTGAAGAVTGWAFTPNVVSVIGSGPGVPLERYASFGAGTSYDLMDGPALATGITTLDLGGFSFGTDPSVSEAGKTFYYWATKALAGAVSTGTYTGDGTASRTVTGLGFNPTIVFVRPLAGGTGLRATHRTVSMPPGMALPFADAPALATGITGFTTNGFTIGDDASVNQAGVSYAWLAAHAP